MLTPRRFQLEGARFKNKIQSYFRGTKLAWYKILKPAVNAAPPFIAMADGANTKNPQVAGYSTSLLKSISGGKVSSLTDMHGNLIKRRFHWK